MARIRTLKPEFWTDDIIVELSFAARLFYQGYWNFALCDYGHNDATPKSLKMKIFPADDVDPDALIEELIKWGRLVRKTTPDGRTYLHASTLSKHTKMDSRWNTRCPYCALEGTTKPADPPPSTEELTETRASSDESERARAGEGKGSKGKGSNVPPPSSAATRAHARDALPPPETAAEPEPPGTAEQILTSWINTLPKQPQGAIVNAVGKTVRTALAEGQDPADIAEALALWQAKGNLGPAVLPSLIHQVANHRPSNILALPSRASPTRESTTDQRMRQGNAITAQLEAMEARQ